MKYLAHKARLARVGGSARHGTRTGDAAQVMLGQGADGDQAAHLLGRISEGELTGVALLRELVAAAGRARGTCRGAARRSGARDLAGGGG